jgi:molecular chaperone DnaJ
MRLAPNFKNKIGEPFLVTIPYVDEKFRVPHPHTHEGQEMDIVISGQLKVQVGDNVEIPTIDGRARIKINPGTQPGTTLRLRGKGFPAVQGYGYGRGDIVVNISVYIPETLSKDEKHAFEKMKDSSNLKPGKSVKEKIFRTFKNYFN